MQKEDRGRNNEIKGAKNTRTGNPSLTPELGLLVPDSQTCVPANCISPTHSCVTLFSQRFSVSICQAGITASNSNVERVTWNRICLNSSQIQKVLRGWLRDMERIKRGCTD